MKQAIITGATGFIGARLVKELLHNQIKVIAIGRKKWEDIPPERQNEHRNLLYIQLDMKNIQNLPAQLNEKGVIVDDCVFYNFAWGGVHKLSDLDVYTQVRNIAWSVKALQSAEEIGCKKFIHVGSMEEAFAKEYLSLDYHTNIEYNRHVIYALAKIYSKEMLKAVAAEYNIDLIFTSNSHVLGPVDDKDSLLQVTLGNLIAGNKLEFTSGEQIFDVVSVKDCAKAYRLIGEKGVKNRKYWIGSGSPRQLKEYIERMAALYPSDQPLEFGKISYNDVRLKKEAFSIKKLQKDTGFVPGQTYEDAVHDLYRWIKYGDVA